MTGNHDGIGPPRQPWGLARERLAQQTLYAISLDRAAHLAGYRQAKSRRAILFLARKHVQDQLA
jgi:hypothetical protein